MKLTKRKGFNFFRSYYDVFNELETDKDKLAFIEALLDKQFLGVNPTQLKGMAKFAYISQSHSIDTQVKGYETKTKTTLSPNDGDLDTPTEGGRHGGETIPTLQEKEKEKGEVQYVKDGSAEPKFNFSKSLIELGVEKDVVSDWLAVRKNKKMTNSKIAFNAIEKELGKLNNISSNEAVKLAVVKSWGGLKAEWVANELKLDLKANDDFDMVNPPEDKTKINEWLEERRKRLIKDA